MQLTNERLQQDVYADVATGYAASPFATNQDTQEFSIEDIQQKLGELTTEEEVDVRGASADLMPSSQTLKMSYQRQYAGRGARIASKLNTKEKVAIACYAVAVCLLIAAIAWCGVTVSGNFSFAAIKTNEYSDFASRLEQLNQEVQDEDYTEMDRRAQDLGYTSTSSSNTMGYTELETRPAQNFHVDSNWFDALCDWLCSIFGA